jgi:hypothetical protein
MSTHLRAKKSRPSFEGRLLNNGIAGNRYQLYEAVMVT